MNIWNFQLQTSDKSWEPGKLDHLITWSLDHLFTWSLDHLHSLIHSIWTCWTTFVFMSMLKSHSHILSLSLSLSHSHTLSISHSLTLNKLNNFCFHVYAQKSLFKVENANDFFLQQRHTEARQIVNSTRFTWTKLYLTLRLETTFIRKRRLNIIKQSCILFLPKWPQMSF